MYTMVPRSFSVVFGTVLLITLVSAQSLYSKGSAVVQVDGKGYSKLIAKSNQVSVSLDKHHLQRLK